MKKEYLDIIDLIEEILKHHPDADTDAIITAYENLHDTCCKDRKRKSSKRFKRKCIKSIFPFARSGGSVEMVCLKLQNKVGNLLPVLPKVS